NIGTISDDFSLWESKKQVLRDVELNGGSQKRAKNNNTTIRSAQVDIPILVPPLQTTQSLAFACELDNPLVHDPLHDGLYIGFGCGIIRRSITITISGGCPPFACACPDPI